MKFAASDAPRPAKAGTTYFAANFRQLALLFDGRFGFLVATGAVEVADGLGLLSG
jgi:hypothetical protein